MHNLFDLTGRNVLITGAGGLLGPKHAEAIMEQNGNVIVSDRNYDKVQRVAQALNDKYNCNRATPEYMNVVDVDSIYKVVNSYETIDVLINNAAKDPKVKKGDGLTPETRFEVMTKEYWTEGIDAIVNGTFFCSQIVSNKMLTHGGGVILNVASDLGVIAPDQRLYRRDGVSEEKQNVKPITYSAAKWAVIGMTKYLAVYYADRNIRVNALSPSGVYNNHPEDFTQKLSNIIPMGRMSHIDEFKGAIMFLCSDASSYMTGENVIIDGGKTVW